MHKVYDIFIEKPCVVFIDIENH